MTAQERGFFCQLLASLFCPPDQELAKQIQKRRLYSFFDKYIQSWGEEEGFLKGFLMEKESENPLRVLENEYARLFSGSSQGNISLVESFHKLWTNDPQCSLPFASEKGLLMGDSAIHLLEIYRECSLEISEESKWCPDHIVVELEFLSYLYERATDIEIKKFIEDHLDWIPFLEEEFKRFHAHPFYLSLLGVLSLFLNVERRRLEIGNNG